MKRSFLLLTLALLLAAVPAVAETPAAGAETASLLLEEPAAPATPAVADLAAGEEPLFLDDIGPIGQNCTTTYSCVDQTICEVTRTPLKVATRTCCPKPCTSPPCHIGLCTTDVFVAGCC